MRRFVAGLAAIVFGVFGLSTPAQAAHVGPAGYVTVYDGCSVGFCGAAWPLKPGTSYVCHGMPSGSDNRISAVDSNAPGKNITFSSGYSCKDPLFTFYNGTMDGQLTNGNPPGQGNNSYSSYYWW